MWHQYSIVMPTTTVTTVHLSSFCLVLEAGLALHRVKKFLDSLEIVWLKQALKRDSVFSANKGIYILKHLIGIIKLIFIYTLAGEMGHIQLPNAD